ncbi:hypothetical protein PENTCL1PPCAC_15006 [Pristionchus entomophagus]|uniref:Uncharacterized protein n=1 Tax=Pristionchus entomophagus TaxID=358040 RepID=A0AAV5TB99_9BILA|nr:hypothetical protein PENTCL1PPCAC_15006 [Pristionchus entomophagus]
MENILIKIGFLQYLEVTVPKEEVAEMLQYVHSTIQHCVIDHFEFNSPDELCVSLIESFFLGVAVEEGCFAGLAYSTWQFALGAIKRLGLDFTKIGAHRSLEDAVDRLILKRDHWERVIDPVGLVLAIFSRRCSHLELESVYLTEDEINQLARKLPSLDKKIYFYAKVSQGVTKRMFLSGPLNVDVKIEQLTGIVEMWYDGMRKQHL